MVSIHIEYVGPHSNEQPCEPSCGLTKQTELFATRSIEYTLQVASIGIALPTHHPLAR